jgi:hypothetical protein
MSEESIEKKEKSPIVKGKKSREKKIGLYADGHYTLSIIRII